MDNLLFHDELDAAISFYNEESDGKKPKSENDDGKKDENGGEAGNCSGASDEIGKYLGNLSLILSVTRFFVNLMAT